MTDTMNFDLPEDVRMIRDVVARFTREKLMPLEPLVDKWRAFNWHVQEIDGHNMQQIIDAVEEAKAVFEKPSVIIARTIPGKGVREFERKFEWHGKPPNKEEAKMALDELRTLGGKIKSEHK